MRIPDKSKKLGALMADRDTIGQESVCLEPEEPEDMWHANNLIMRGDTLRAHAVRKVVTTGRTGTTESVRVHTTITIRVRETAFDAAALSLRVAGTVVQENEHAAMGQAHTLTLELHRPFVLWKKNGWDSVARAALHEALRADKADALAAVVLGDGQASVCLITDYQTRVQARVAGALPKKMAASADLDSGTRTFFGNTLAALQRTVDFSAAPRVLLLASPGYTARNFQRFVADAAARSGDKVLRQVARDAVVVHTSAGNVHALDEVLKSPEAAALVRDGRHRAAARLLEDLGARLRHDDGRVAYGPRPVERAVREGAVGRGGGALLVNNALFRSHNLATRRRYVALVDRVKADGGEVHLLSSDHERGQRLDALSGIAAILTYPMFDLDEEYDKADDEAPADEDSDEEGDATGTTII